MATEFGIGASLIDAPFGPRKTHLCLWSFADHFGGAGEFKFDIGCVCHWYCFWLVKACGVGVVRWWPALAHAQ